VRGEGVGNSGGGARMGGDYGYILKLGEKSVTAGKES